jgi:DNA-binding transcriptional LysR family regulator
MPVGLESALLFEEHFLLVARKGHPAFADGNVLEAFWSMPHVFFGYRDPGVESLLDGTRVADGRRCFVQLRTPSFNQAADVLAHTDMVSVFPSRLARHFSALLDSYDMPVPIDGYRTCLYWDRRTDDDPGLRWLREQIGLVAQDVDAQH